MRSRGSHEAVDIRTFLLAHPSSSDPYVRLSTLNSGPPKKQSVWPATADLRRSGRGLGTTGKKRTNPRRLARLHRHVGRFACPARQAPGSISAWRQCSADGLALARLTRRRRERTPRVTSWRGKRSDFVRPFARVGRVGSGRDWWR
jgi:hypothetical protein